MNKVKALQKVKNVNKDYVQNVRSLAKHHIYFIKYFFYLIIWNLKYMDT